MLLHLWNDFRYAARRLSSSPGFTASAVVTIALGVGINTGIFSVLNGIALRELPAPDAGELVTIDQLIEGGAPYLVEGSASMFSAAEFSAYRERVQTLTGVLGYSTQFGVWLGDDTPRSMTGTFVTCGYFDVLRQLPVLGRGFTVEDCAPGAAPAVVLGHDVWTSAFGADLGLVGRNVLLSGQSFTVIGIAPEGARGLDFVPVSFFAPITMQPLLQSDRDMFNDERTKWLRLIGRRADGAQLDAVRAELGVIAAQLDTLEPPRKTRLVIDRARRLAEPSIQSAVFGIGGVLMAAFGLVLLVACANVANLVLARGLGRNREIAVRLSLGASRARVVQSLLAESVLIGATGGALGGALAMWSSQSLFAFVLSKVPDVPELLVDTSPDVRVLSFGLVLSLATGILCGLAPALRVSRPDLHTAVKLDAVGPGSRRAGRLQSTLVAVQVAVCMVLMVAAALLLRGLHTAQTVDPGFAYEDIAVLSLDRTGRSDPERTASLQPRVMERIGSLPGIEAVAQVAAAPLSATRPMSQARLPGEGEAFVANVNTVSPGYFALVGIPIVRGRTFTDAELTDASTAVIVTEATARRLWPGQDPIGQALFTARADIRTGESQPEQTFEVVGVASDAQVGRLGTIPSQYLYLPATPQTAALRLLVKSRVDLAATTAAIAATAAELDPDLVVRLEPLEANLDLWRDLSALVSTLATSLGALALVLASVGVYGVVAYAVGRRAREIGIRLALGASPRSVVELMLRRTMRPVVIGAVIGVAAAAGAARLLSSVLFGVSPADPLALAGAALFVAGVALAAGTLSARRAARVDPNRTLHYE